MKEPDFKGLYYHLMHETERAIGVLVSAQQYCEAEYLEQTEKNENEMFKNKAAASEKP